jgi:uroporphyrinogen decarboxylase
MKPRERVFAALDHREPDRVPRFEIWIDAFLEQLGHGDAQRAYVEQGQDCVMLPSQTPPDSHAWRDGVDEWGRVWKNGMYVSGVVDTCDDLRRYSPPLDYVERLFDPERAQAVRRRYPDHCLIYGTHIGPMTAAYMAMGFERFFTRLFDDPALVRQVLEARTDWCIAQYRQALSLGAEVLILGDDVAFRDGPMISPRMYRDWVLPCHRRIVEALDAPVVWHSDGDIRSLLPFAVEAGFVGVHGLEPAAGVDLGEVKREFGRELALIGNVDVRVLVGEDLDAVRRDVDRCLEQGAPGGGYMIASCNSIFNGMNLGAVQEMFRYAGEAGHT